MIKKKSLAEKLQIINYSLMLEMIFISVCVALRQPIVNSVQAEVKHLRSLQNVNFFLNTVIKVFFLSTYIVGNT